MATIEYKKKLRAAMARVEGHQVQIATLTISCASLEDDLRIYMGGAPDDYMIDGLNEVPYIMCKLEDGSVKRFLELPFDIKLPDENDGASRRASLVVSNINRDIGLAAKKANDLGEKVFVTFRGYLHGSHGSELGSEPLTFEVKKVSMADTKANIEMMISMPNMHDLKFPFKKYNVADHPYLIGQSRQYEG